jgi:hypothetical protein
MIAAIRITCVLILGLLLNQCKTRDELVGHWHYISQIHSDFKTLDITDSLVISDKYETWSAAKIKFTRHVDSLFVIGEGQYQKKYVRSDAARCRLADRYRKSSVTISLEPSNDALPIDVAYKDFKTHNIFVGKLAREDKYCDSLADVYPDSIFVHAKIFNWIRISRLPAYYSFMDYGMLSDEFYHYDTTVKDDSLTLPDDYPGVFQPVYNYHRPLGVVLHADKSVTGEFLGKIISQVPDTIPVTFFRAVLDKNGEIGLKRLTVN